MSERCDICGLMANVGPHGDGVCTPSAHHKISETVVPFICSERDCEHHALGIEPCPSSQMDICDECTRESWEEWEGPVTAWEDCRIRPCADCGGIYLAHWDRDHEWIPNRTIGASDE